MTSQKFKFNRGFYQWLQSCAGWKLMRSGDAVAEVVPDLKFPNMFRIKIPGMPPSDIVNLTRAKDAALSLADAVLDGRIASLQAPRIALSAGATRLQADDQNALRRHAGANPTCHHEGIASQHAAEPADDAGQQVRGHRVGGGKP
jgi:hypothetical protein